MKKILFSVFFGLFVLISYSQQTPTIGISDTRPGKYAFTNATIFIDYKTKIEKATLLVEDNKIKAVGKNIEVPEGYRNRDLEGKYIYPSFIDPYTSYGIPEVKEPESQDPFSPEYYIQTRSGRSEDHPVNWNDAINAHYDAVHEFNIDKEKAEELRKMGFGTVLSFRSDGIARGTSVLVTLMNESENKAVLNPLTANHFSFDKGSSRQTYPTSLMGSIALLRQTYYDAQWYKKNNPNYTDITLEAINQNQDLPQIFEVTDKKDLLRADRIGDEFGIQYIIKGNGDEYQAIEQVKKTNAPLILPVTFPDAPSVKDPYKADEVSLQELRHWELAPSVFSILKENNIAFAITSQGIKDEKTFFQNIRKALQYGLDEETALKALTYTPAFLLNAENTAGALKKGYLANFLITSGEIFDPSCTIYENWVQGKSYKINDSTKEGNKGTYVLTIADKTYQLNVLGETGKEKFSVYTSDSTELETVGKIENSTIHLNIKVPDKENNIRLAGWKVKTMWKGNTTLPTGQEAKWNAQLSGKSTEKELDKKLKKPLLISRMTYPFIAYGYEEKPEEKTYLIKNATVWTNEEAGIVEGLDVLVKDGKISQVGKNLHTRNAEIIDGTGKHLTSGVIDEHSHIAIEGGTNEFSHAITSEVRIKDVVNPEDINIYRQLSGGVTAAQILHGSANPIGGQSAIMKHRWGASAENLLIEDATQFLKHALGENVKQSRLPAFVTSRYPQTRMGVEAILRDAYMQAEEYKEEWEAYNQLSEKEKGKAVQPRKDLRLQAIADLLEEKSYITCHTYVKSETDMIMNLAEDFGIKAHTLIHNTEGYKIADNIKEHEVFASNLPDWWAYKFEVYDAIPYNTAIQTREGIVSAIHSDNAELARRLNQEAAKTIKYGGLTQEEAWKLVTLNPAKILHLDHRMGSIKKGKDADLVLWSDNPLSVYARAEKTMVDGIIYYDAEKDKKMHKAIEKERDKLINKILNESGTN